MPSRIEIAEAMEIDVEELDSVLRQALSTSSLDAVSYTHLTLPTTPYV